LALGCGETKMSENDASNTRLNNAENIRNIRKVKFPFEIIKSAVNSKRGGVEAAITATNEYRNGKDCKASFIELLLIGFFQ